MSCPPPSPKLQLAEVFSAAIVHANGAFELLYTFHSKENAQACLHDYWHKLAPEVRAFAAPKIVCHVIWPHYDADRHTTGVLFKADTEGDHHGS